VVQTVHNLIGELVAWTPRAAALRATALDHEVGDHAVEVQTVVVGLSFRLGVVGHGTCS